MGGIRRAAVVTALALLSCFLVAPPAAAAQVSGPKPTIAGSAVVGHTLTANPGVWRPAGTTLAFQWFRVSGRSRSEIPGATRATYTVRSSDIGSSLMVRVTGSKERFTSLSMWSDATAEVAKPSLTRTPTPTISGTARVGHTLTAHPGAWAPAPVSLSYQWYRGGTAIHGAYRSTYRAVSADLGYRLKVRVTGSKSGYASVGRWSAATAVVAKPSLTRTPTPWITGTARVGRTVTVHVGAWEPAPVALSFQWYRGGSPIRGAHGRTHLVEVADLGHRLSVRVTGSKSGYASTSRWSASTARVSKGLLTKAPMPKISGAVEIGQILTVKPGAWGPGRVKVKYQWYCNGLVIKGATKATYQLRPGDLGCVMRVTATGSRTGYQTLGKDSSPTVPVQVSRIQVSAGAQHTCLVNGQGGVLCWGGNGLGALGDGTTIDRLTPVPVVGLATGVRAVYAGSRHTCALTLAGGVKCWGGNAHGQLGDGGTADRSTPVDVVGLSSGVVSMFSGYDYSCALLDAGRVKCWGANNFAQLGDANDPWDSTTPVDVIGVGGQSLLSGIIALAPSGYAHACAITSNNGVDCWGWNFDGELGNGTDHYSATAVAVSGLSRSPIVSIGVGTRHSCGVTSWGSVKCWGRGDDGQLGNGTVTEQHAPKTMPNLIKDVASISAGGSHNCVLMKTGGVKCWGWGEKGQLGNGHSTSSIDPVAVAGLSGVVVSLSAGGGHTCAAMAVPVGEPPRIKCWGEAWFGQLGDGTTGDAYHERNTPVDVVGL